MHLTCVKNAFKAKAAAEKQAWPGIRVCPFSLLFTLEEILFEIFLKIKKI